MDPALAAQLWERLCPLFTVADYVGVKPYGFGTNGNWRPYGVNECVRVAQSSSGDHFSLHRDGGYVATPNERSALTLMVFLTTDYEGGGLQLMHTHVPGCVPLDVGFEFVPAAIGDAIVFTQDVWHLATEITNGVKVTARFDVMYRRVGWHRLTADLGCSKEELEAEKLYWESVALQKEGNAKLSTEKFVAAQEIHAIASPCVLAARAVAPLPGPPEADCGSLAQSPLMADWCLRPTFSHVADPAQLATCALVCRRWRNTVRDPLLWAVLFEARWPGRSPAIPLPLFPETYSHWHFAELHSPVVWAVFNVGDVFYGIAGRSPGLKEFEASHFLFDRGQFGVDRSGMGCHASHQGLLRDLKQRREQAGIIAHGDGVFSVPADLRRCRGHYWSASSPHAHLSVASSPKHYPDFERVPLAVGGDSDSGGTTTPPPLNINAARLFMGWIQDFGFPDGPLIPQRTSIVIIAGDGFGPPASADFGSSWSDRVVGRAMAALPSVAALCAALRLPPPPPEERDVRAPARCVAAALSRVEAREVLSKYTLPPLPWQY